MVHSTWRMMIPRCDLVQYFPTAPSRFVPTLLHRQARVSHCNLMLRSLKDAFFFAIFHKNFLSLSLPLCSTRSTICLHCFFSQTRCLLRSQCEHKHKHSSCVRKVNNRMSVLTKLCSLIVQEHFGETVKRVSDALYASKTKTVSSLCQATKLSRKEVNKN